MSKDELIADLRQQVATLSRLLEMALDKQPPEISAGAARQKRYRERLALRNTVTSPVTSHSDAPPRESDLPSFLQGDVKDVTNVIPDPKLEGKTHTESASQKRNGVTPFDRERAAEDAAKQGLLGTAFEAELEHFEDYWTSAGWRRKNGPVKDRNATWREWLRSPYRRPNGNGTRLTYSDQDLEDLRLMQEAGA